MAVEARIGELLKSHDVVLFMKGTRRSPRCGFSQRVVDILDEYLDDYATVDVLADPALREGIKRYSHWPTIPQLYVRERFIGGSDIVHEMVQQGELAEALGTGPIAMPEPSLTVTPAARGAFGRFWDQDGEPVVRLTVGSDFEPLLDLDEERAGDVVVRDDGLTVVMARSTARRVDGVSIDFVEKDGQVGFKVDNPNRPPAVASLAVAELARWRKAGKPHLLVDVRTPVERATASIEGSVLFDGALEATLEDLDRDRTLVFFCHHGMRSRVAAEHAVQMGFRDVHNLEGGIDAWSAEVDPEVPRY